MEAHMNQTIDKAAALRNRRITQRREARGSVRIECRKGSLGLGKDIGDRVLDVSEDGIRVILKEDLPLKQEVEIVIYPQGSRQAIKRLANVVWVVAAGDKCFCVGLKFQKRVAYADVGRIGRP
jgi:hypothetical protein